MDERILKRKEEKRQPRTKDFRIFHPLHALLHHVA
jgi:hypothetical protein